MLSKQQKHLIILLNLQDLIQTQLLEERNKEKNKANEFLKKEGKEEIILETNDEVKKQKKKKKNTQQLAK